jgi:hypothetical protein
MVGDKQEKKSAVAPVSLLPADSCFLVRACRGVLATFPGPTHEFTGEQAPVDATLWFHFSAPSRLVCVAWD